MSGAKRAKTAASIAQAAGLRVSARALSRVLDVLDTLDEFDPDECAPSTLTRELHSWHEHVRCPLGAIFTTLDVPLDDGSVHAWRVASPFALLWHLANEAPAFGEFLCDTIGNRISDLTLWGDEVCNGNALRPDNRNKYVAVYISFHQWPAWWRWLDEGWLPIGVMSYTVMQTVKSKYSGLLKCVLQFILRGATNFIDGFLVKVHSGRFIRVQSRCLGGTNLGAYFSLRFTLPS
jgi:hypothetical protein